MAAGALAVAFTWQPGWRPSTTTARAMSDGAGVLAMAGGERAGEPRCPMRNTADPSDVARVRRRGIRVSLEHALWRSLRGSVFFLECTRRGHASAVAGRRSGALTLRCPAVGDLRGNLSDALHGVTSARSVDGAIPGSRFARTDGLVLPHARAGMLTRPSASRCSAVAIAAIAVTRDTDRARFASTIALGWHARRPRVVRLGLQAGRPVSHEKRGRGWIARAPKGGRVATLTSRTLTRSSMPG